MTPYITFMTDFGTRDDSAGCCRGVMLGRAPDAVLIDLTHEIPAFDIRRGALTWQNVLPYMPVGVHVGVVDPGVGTTRRPVAVRAGRGDVLVGPDNGLVAAGAAALGGAVEAVELSNPAFMLQPLSRTFHGRDIFSPAAAAFATGTPLATLGSALDVSSLVALHLPEATWEGDLLRCAVSYIDDFGNLRLNAGEDVVERWSLREGETLSIALGAQSLTVPFARSFGLIDAGRTAVIVDSYRRLMIAVNRGNAARTYGMAIDDVLTLRRG